MLVAGGENASARFDSVEIFDPSTGTWELQSATMNESRAHHHATRLLDGRLLIAGGWDTVVGSDTIESFEIYDQTTASWTMDPTWIMQGVEYSTGVLLEDGRVLAVGREPDVVIPPPDSSLRPRIISSPIPTRSTPRTSSTLKETSSTPKAFASTSSAKGGWISTSPTPTASV